MPSSESIPLRLEFHALTPDRWHDLETLFGERGACGGCWCMWWKLKRSEFVQGKGAHNKKAFERIVAAGEIPGLIAYAGDGPVGWCAMEPRNHYQRLGNSRVLKPVDAQPVWSVVCFFVAKPYRRKGVTSRLLKAAVQYAGENGATIVEGYPVDPKSAKMPDAFAYTGLPASFRSAGFVEVLRRSPTRPIMRFYLKGSKTKADKVDGIRKKRERAPRR
jgi:GNAT superfamily N-acetyltransferase